ncbi:MAG TPA: hypothetical protein VMV68_00975 [Spirochaetia bacterium]|nr:hypothetical protein [Spirochaetia bacterium]
MSDASGNSAVSGLNEIIWERQVSFEENQIRLWHVGAARFWIRRTSGEWFVAFEPPNKDSSGSAETAHQLIVGREEAPPEGLQWTRYVAGDSNKIAVRPILPDRPVVVRPIAPVKVLSGRSVQYFIHIPVWLSITESADHAPLLLTEHPGLQMSSTWFGDPDNGELCYSLTAELVLSHVELEGYPLAAICPLKISNLSPAILDFQRVCVRVPYLHLYRGERFLSTNEVELTYRGPEQSQISLQSRIPGFDREIRHVSQPRVKVSRSIIKKSFELIRALSNY